MGLEKEDILVLPSVLRIVDTFDAMSPQALQGSPTPLQGGPNHGRKGGRQKERADLGQDVRDQGMRQCFDEDLLGKFIVFLGHMKLANF